MKKLLPVLTLFFSFFLVFSVYGQRPAGEARPERKFTGMAANSICSEEFSHILNSRSVMLRPRNINLYSKIGCIQNTSLPPAKTEFQRSGFKSIPKYIFRVLSSRFSVLLSLKLRKKVLSVSILSKLDSDFQIT